VQVRQIHFRLLPHSPRVAARRGTDGGQAPRSPNSSTRLGESSIEQYIVPAGLRDGTAERTRTGGRQNSASTTLLRSPRATFAGKPHILGTKGALTLHPHQFARDEVVPLDHLRGVADGRIRLAPDLCPGRHPAGTMALRGRAGCHRRAREPVCYPPNAGRKRQQPGPQVRASKTRRRLRSASKMRLI
jgi:hypothetical protein